MSQPMDPTPDLAMSPGQTFDVTVDLDAVAANVRTLIAATAATHAAPQVMAVVKADAYGHGLVPVARAARHAGATWLGTAQLGEALALRASGDTGRILTWLASPGADFEAALRADVDLSVGGAWALEEILAAASRTGLVPRLHVKVDTGLARGGAFGDDLAPLLRAALDAEQAGRARVVGLWSHLVEADAPGHPTNRYQQSVFEDAVALVESFGARLEVRHLANSAATLTNPAIHYDLVRPGIAVYGLSPVPQQADSTALRLRPAMRVTARLALTKRVPVGQGVSYGHLYRTPTETVLGLVPMGYADGLPRNATNVGPLSVAGRRLTVAGRVCMDQVVVDLGPDAEAMAGDEVVLVGGPAPGEPTAQDWADATGTISYEIVTRLAPRAPRRYVGELAGTLLKDEPTEQTGVRR